MKGLFRKKRPFLIIGMTNKQQKIILSLMSANALLFAAIFLLVASNYRLAVDDFHHVATVSERGVWGAMMYYYENWNSRWSSILATNTFLSYGNNQIAFFIYFCATFLLGFIAVWSFINSISRAVKLPFTTGQTAIISLYLLAATFYISFSKNDTWYWITVGPMYLWGTFAAILGGSLLLQSWIPKIRYVLVCLLFLYAGGASESAAIATLIALFYIGVRTKRETEWIDRNAMHIGTISCMIGFAILLLGSGLTVRREHLPQYPFSERLIVGLWNYIKFDLIEIPKKLPLLILFMAPFGFFGRKQLRYQLVSIKDVFWSNRKIWILADLTIAILAMALGYVMCEMGPTRAWFPITIIVLSVGLVLAYQLGTWVYLKTNGKLFQLATIALVAVFLAQMYFGFSQFNISRSYAKAVDERMLSIHSVPDTQHLVALERLPESGWLMSSDIQADSTHFTNKHLGLFFGNEHTFVVRDTLN